MEGYTIQYILFDLMDKLSKISITTFIACIGAITGTLTFYYTFLKRFNPKCIISGDIIFHCNKGSLVNNDAYLKEIEFNITFSNESNKYGLIEDLLVRIYSTDGITKETTPYFVSLFKDHDNPDKLTFYPVVLIPKSFRSATFIFSDRIAASEKIINIDRDYNIQLFIKYKKENNWVLVDDITLYCKVKDNTNQLFDLIFMSINQQIIRDNAKNYIGKIPKPFYKGIIHQWLKNILEEIKFFITKIIYKLLHFIQFIYHLILSVINWIVSLIVINNLLIFLSSKTKEVKTSGQIGPDKPTLNYINKLHKVILKLINKINSRSDNKIDIQYKGSDISLSRNNFKIIIYAPGVNHIMAHDQESHEYKLFLKFIMVTNRINHKYWTYDDKFISITKMAIKIIDSFSLLTQYTNISSVLKEEDCTQSQ